jgi:alpha-tubulin suppressor-like RCC1 family protein
LFYHFICATSLLEDENMKSKVGILLMAFLLIIAIGGCDEDPVPVETCGDGVLDIMEECDGTNYGGTTCQTMGFHPGTIFCDDNCKVIASSCGGKCGDNLLNGDEECDGDFLDDASCTTLGYYGGTLTCGVNCKFEKLECVAQGRCGDNVVQSGHEDCDGQEMADDATCENEGYGGGGNLSCTIGCLFDYSGCIGAPYCGDLIKQGDEKCDNTDYGNSSCFSLGYYGGNMECTGDCQLDLSDCKTYGICGDGEIQSSHSETCDGTNFNGVSCTSLGYYGGNLQCSNSCETSTEQCIIHGICGDGIIQDDWYDETCDGTILGFGSDQCSEIFWHGGTIGCDSECHYEINECNWLTQLDAGESHSCGIDRYGVLHCMGTNGAGELGLGFADFPGGILPPRTVDILAHVNIIQVSAGYGYTCAVDSDGTGWCWGETYGDKLGIGTTTGTRSPTPLQVLMPDDVDLSSISTGGSQSSSTTCGLDTTGAAWCWGDGTSIGDTINADSATPVEVLMQPGINFTKLTCGFSHCCSIDSDGGAWCWGEGSFDQLGTGITTDASAPTQIPSPPSGEWIDISAGWRYTCAVELSGGVYCWGFDGDHLGMGDEGYNIATPTVILPTGALFISVSTSLSDNSHTCAIDTDGQIWCWGYNYYGQLGDGSEMDSSTPVQSYNMFQSYLPGSLSVGAHHTAVLSLQNKPYCFGKNGSGACGLGQVQQMVIPLAIPGPQ